MASDSSRKRLPFEPGNRKTEADEASKAPAKVRASQAKDSKAGRSTSTQGTTKKAVKAKDAAIPEEVSRRMLRRMIIFSGIPTLLGVSTFFVSYFLVVNQIVELPSYFVLFATLGCFGLGVVGLSYGALSASWDEGRLGHWFGVDEFKVNFGRLTSSWGSKADH